MKGVLQRKLHAKLEAQRHLRKGGTPQEAAQMIRNFNTDDPEERLQKIKDMQSFAGKVKGMGRRRRKKQASQMAQLLNPEQKAMMREQLKQSGRGLDTSVADSVLGATSSSVTESSTPSLKPGQVTETATSYQPTSRLSQAERDAERARRRAAQASAGAPALPKLRFGGPLKVQLPSLKDLTMTDTPTAPATNAVANTYEVPYPPLIPRWPPAVSEWTVPVAVAKTPTHWMGGIRWLDRTCIPVGIPSPEPTPEQPTSVPANIAPSRKYAYVKGVRYWNEREQFRTHVDNTLEPVRQWLTEMAPGIVHLAALTKELKLRGIRLHSMQVPSRNMVFGVEWKNGMVYPWFIVKFQKR